MDNKNIIKIGKKNSAQDKPNQIPLNALPLLLLKYLLYQMSQKLNFPLLNLKI